MNSQITTHIVGHISSEPRTFKLSNGVGCDIRVLVTRSFFNEFNAKISRELYLKVVTYDSVMTEQLVRDYKMGDYVEIVADNVRVEKPWKNKLGEPRSGSVVFPLQKIRKVTATDPETEHEAAKDAELLEGVTVA